MAGDAFQVIVDSREVEVGFSKLEITLSVQSLDFFLKEHVVQYLQARATERFQSEGDSATGAWAALKDSTVAIRAYGIESGKYSGIGPSHPINRRTGDLENFITSDDGEVGEGTLLWPSSTPEGEMAAKIGHAQRGGVGFPARPVIGFDETDVVAVLEMLEQFARDEGGLL